MQRLICLESSSEYKPKFRIGEFYPFFSSLVGVTSLNEILFMHFRVKKVLGCRLFFHLHERLRELWNLYNFFYAFNPDPCIMLTQIKISRAKCYVYLIVIILMKTCFSHLSKNSSSAATNVNFAGDFYNGDYKNQVIFIICKHFHIPLFLRILAVGPHFFHFSKTN